MMKVEMHVYTPWELAIVHEAMSIIHKARAAQQEALHGNPPPGQRVAVDEIAADQAAEQPGPGAQVVGHIGPKEEPAAHDIVPPPAPAADAMKYEAVEAAMHKALKTHGSEKTRAILLSYDKKARDLDPAVWPELVQRLEEGK